MLAIAFIIIALGMWSIIIFDAWENSQKSFQTLLKHGGDPRYFLSSMKKKT